MRRLAAALATALAVAACEPASQGPSTLPEATLPAPTAPTTSADLPVPTVVTPASGGAGVGDSLFPLLGNGGYDVQTYTIRLNLVEPEGSVEGSVRIEAVALQDLGRFHIDLVGMEVEQVEIGGQGPTEFLHAGRELIVTPEEPILEGEDFRVVVDYRGMPRPVTQGPAPYGAGWQRSETGFFAFSQPDGAAGWFPANDHPSDAATVFLQVEVPSRYQVVSSGELVTSQREDGRRLWSYHLPAMAPYMIPVAIGEFRQRSSLVGGRPYALWYEVGLEGEPGLEAFGLQPAITEHFEDAFGPYPFELVGGLVVDSPLPAALETMELATYTRRSLAVGHQVVAHEISHQWFGNWVRLAEWRDIWLNEGLATFAQWMWLEHHEGEDRFEEAVRSSYRLLSGQAFVDQGVAPGDAAARAARSFPPPGDPKADDLFNASVYLRGGLTLVALRDQIGEARTLSLLRAWIDRHGGSTATTGDFLALVAEREGGAATELVEEWLFRSTIPPLPGWDLAPLGG